MLCVTSFKDKVVNLNQFYRATILDINKEEQKVLVFFVDYGNREEKMYHEIFELSNELQEYPFQAFRCQLANIKMSLYKNPNGTWTKAANDKFKSIIALEIQKKNRLKIKVLGITKSNVVMCKLGSAENENEIYDIGQKIVESEFAELVDVELENCLHKFNKNNSKY